MSPNRTELRQHARLTAEPDKRQLKVEVEPDRAGLGLLYRLCHLILSLQVKFNASSFTSRTPASCPGRLNFEPSCCVYRSELSLWLLPVPPQRLPAAVEHQVKVLLRNPRLNRNRASMNHSATRWYLRPLELRGLHLVQSSSRAGCGRRTHQSILRWIPSRACLVTLSLAEQSLMARSQAERSLDGRAQVRRCPHRASDRATICTV